MPERSPAPRPEYTGKAIPAVGVPGRLEDGDHPGALRNQVLEHAPGAGQPGHEESAPRDR
jgi:hypothetical protein